MGKIKAVYILRGPLHGDRAMEIRQARREASQQVGYTKTADPIVHRKTIEFPQGKGYSGKGAVRFDGKDRLVKY